MTYIPDVSSLYAQTVQGPTINTVGEQSIIGTGEGSLTVPANWFRVGDSYHGKIGGLINATGGGNRSEIIIKIKRSMLIFNKIDLVEDLASINYLKKKFQVDCVFLYLLKRNQYGLQKK